MDIISAYREVGSYRGAAAICETTPKTVRRVIERHEAGGGPERKPAGTELRPGRRAGHHQDRRDQGRMSAKRLLPLAVAAGYEARAGTSGGWSRRRRPSGAAVITAVGARRSGPRASTWSSIGACWAGCTCSARCWLGRGSGSSGSPTTNARPRPCQLLAECFEVLGGVPEVVLADRMGCLEGRRGRQPWWSRRPDYVRFATHYGFRPGFLQRCSDPQSKGMVENLVGYAKTRSDGRLRPRRRSVTTCGSAGGERRRKPVVRRRQRGEVHSEIVAVPAARARRPRSGRCCGRAARRLRPRDRGARWCSRRVDKLSCIRFGSARYSVPCHR